MNSAGVPGDSTAGDGFVSPNDGFAWLADDSAKLDAFGRGADDFENFVEICAGKIGDFVDGSGAAVGAPY